MTANRFFLGLAAAALVVAVGASLYTSRRIDELQAANDKLEQELRARSAAQPVTASEPPPPALGGPGHVDADAVQVARLSNRLEALEASMPGISDDAIARYERLEGRARANALEDLEPFARQGDAEATQVVIGALRDADPKVREEAIKVIAELGDPRLLTKLAPLVNDPNPDVRKELADVLEDTAAENAGPMLLTMLDDPNPDVVEDVVKALGKLRYEPARARLSGLADPENLRLTGAVGAALRNLGDERGVSESLDTLATGLDSDDPERRRLAVKEIGQVGGAEARTILERALDDTDYRVRSEARKRIAKLGVR